MIDMASNVMTYSEEDALLMQDMGELSLDPYRWTLYAFCWGEGDLVGRSADNSLEDWQKEFLIEWGKDIREKGFDPLNPVPVLPYQKAVASGHGIGKSALVAIIVWFICSTRPFCKGIVTANTNTQLETKTWAEVKKWHNRLICTHWFKCSTSRGNMKIQHINHEDWRVDAITWDEHNPDAFAGQHAYNSSPFYIFDEASAIPAIIWEVAKGGLTDGEPFFFAFGNPTMNKGAFFDCFHSKKKFWHTSQIDSRTVGIANKEYLKQLIEEYGEDSDEVRVRVYGKFPVSANNQLIPTDKIVEAIKRKYVENNYYEHQRIIGVDMAREGDDKTVISTRQGANIRIRHELSGARTGDVVGTLVVLINEWKPHQVFIDSAKGEGVIDRLTDLGYNVTEIKFGSKASNPKLYLNKRTEMYMLMRKAFMQDKLDIPDHDGLKEDLIAITYKWDEAKDIYKLDKKEDFKKELGRSPDYSDSVAITWAYGDLPLLNEMEYLGMQNDNARCSPEEIDIDLYTG